MKILDGHGIDDHVTARQIADANIATFGPGDYVLNVGEKFAYEIISNNKIQIKDGVGISQGVRFYTPKNKPDEMFIENGAQLKQARFDSCGVRKRRNYHC